MSGTLPEISLIAKAIGIEMPASGPMSMQDGSIGGLNPKDTLALFDAIAAMNAKKKSDERLAEIFAKNPIGAATSSAPSNPANQQFGPNVQTTQFGLKF